MYRSSNMTSTKPPDLTLTSMVDLLTQGVSMPRLGFGIYRVQPSETADVVLAAMDVGYRHFDSAQLYNNEAELGRAIRRSDVDRKDVFLTTKIRYPGVNKARTWKKVLDSVKKISGTEVAASRKRKCLDDGTHAGEQVDADGEYVDLLLVHTPYGGPNAKKERMEMWLALERAFEEGRTRSIGVSNYKVEHIEEMREYAMVWPPHVNQIQVGRSACSKASPKNVLCPSRVCIRKQGDTHALQLNPWDQQREVVTYCQEHGIVVQAFSPLARGDRWDEPVLGELADKYGKSPAQILIRYALQKGWVPLSKSERPERMKENALVFDFVVEDEDMMMLDGLDGKKLGYFD